MAQPARALPAARRRDLRQRPAYDRQAEGELTSRRMTMSSKAKVLVAGASGMVGSAVVRELSRRGRERLLTPASGELDLTNQRATRDFFLANKPDLVVLA